jgi:hypothetical protein
LPPTSHEILARFERALSDTADADPPPTILSHQLNSRRLLVVGPPPQVPFALDFTFHERWFELRVSGASFADASENPPANRGYRVLGPPPWGALPSPEIVFEAIPYDDSARIERVLELIASATAPSSADAGENGSQTGGGDAQAQPIRAVTVHELAVHRLRVLGRIGAEEPSGLNGADYAAVGLAILGGCERCGASIAAYNACPSRSGYWRCANGCIADEGWASASDADRALQAAAG